MKYYRYFLGVCCVFFLMACSATNPHTQRSQLMLVSSAEEISMGEKGRDEILKHARISKNQKATHQILRVGKKIAIAANQPDYRWEFYLIEDSQANAFCLPGGKVFVYTGILSFVENDDELATIIGHEVAHAIARHGSERVSMAKVQKIGGGVTSILAQTLAPKHAGLLQGAYALGSQYGVMLPYSRDQELEADKIGLKLMLKAGYNPKAALSFWKKMTAKGKDTFEFLSTHPSDSRRIKQIEQYLQGL